LNLQKALKLFLDLFKPQKPYVINGCLKSFAEAIEENQGPKARPMLTGRQVLVEMLHFKKILFYFLRSLR